MAVLERKWNIADEFSAMLAHRALSKHKEEMRGFSALFEKLIERVMERESEVVAIRPRENSVSATIKFSAREVAEMDKDMQKEFKTTGRVARVLKTESRGEITYEIRYRRNGYNLSVSSHDLLKAKQDFIQETKLKNIKLGA